MGTRAGLFVDEGDGLFSYRHHFFDGYPNEGGLGLGVFLAENLQDKNLVDFILSLNAHFTSLFTRSGSWRPPSEIVHEYPSEKLSDFVVSSRSNTNSLEDNNQTWQDLFEQKKLGFQDYDYVFTDNKWHIVTNLSDEWENTDLAPLDLFLPALALRELSGVLDLVDIDVDVDDMDPATGDMSEINEALDDLGFSPDDLFEQFTAWHQLNEVSQKYLIEDFFGDEYDIEAVMKVLECVDPVARHERISSGIAENAQNLSKPKTKI